MSEEMTPPPQELTAGAMLRRGREASGLHIAALAVGMKVHVKKLEALEADRYESLGDPVFVRALASSMCRTLKLDPGPVLDKLPHYVKPTLNADKSALNTPFREPGGTSLALPAVVRTPTFLIVLCLLVAAIGVIFYPQRPAEVPTQVAVPTTKAPAESAEAAPEPVFVQAPMAKISDSLTAQSPVAAGSAPVQTAIQASPVVNPVAVTAPVSTPVAVQPSAAASVPVVRSSAPSVVTPGQSAQAAGASQLLVLRPKEVSWVQVIDAKGVVQLRKTLQAGEVASVGGELPLAVVVGRADATVVEVRGKVMPLGAITQDNVARFEVK